jgi:hypothetical protein
MRQRRSTGKKNQQAKPLGPLLIEELARIIAPFRDFEWQ